MQAATIFIDSLSENMFDIYSQIRMLSRLNSTCRSCFDLLAEVTEVAPTDCVVEISKSTGELGAYQEVLYCRILLLDLSFLAFVFTEH